MLVEGLKYTEEEQEIVNFVNDKLKESLKCPVKVYIYADMLLIDITADNKIWRSGINDISERIGSPDVDFCLKEYVSEVINNFKKYLLDPYFN